MLTLDLLPLSVMFNWFLCIAESCNRLDDHCWDYIVELESSCCSPINIILICAVLNLSKFRRFIFSINSKYLITEYACFRLVFRSSMLSGYRFRLCLSKVNFCTIDDWKLSLREVFFTIQIRTHYINLYLQADECCLYLLRQCYIITFKHRYLGMHHLYSRRRYLSHVQYTPS